ncbi:MAG TPA: tetratricopeptide repeat protein [Anaerolineae bacterium]
MLAPRVTQQVSAARLIGRDGMLDSIVDRLIAGANMALTAENTSGIGLTALAKTVAQDPLIKARFSAGVLWASLGKQPNSSAILTAWADQLGADIADAADDIARSRALTGAIGARRLLIIIDEACSLADIRLLQCGGMNCVYLITTEWRYLARESAGPENTIVVRELARSAAVEMLWALAPSACAANPELATKAAHATGGLPLSIKLLAGYLAIAPATVNGSRADVYTTRLKNAVRCLGMNVQPSSRLQQAIALSLTDLPAQSLRAFYNLGAFVPAPATFARTAMLAVTQADQATIDQLVQRHLIETTGDSADGYLIHPAIANIARVRRDPKTVARHRACYVAAAGECADDWRAMDALYPQLAHAWALAPDDPGLLEFAYVAHAYQQRAGMWRTIEAWAARCAAVGAIHELSASTIDKMQTLITASPVSTSEGHGAVLFDIGSAYERLEQREQALDYYSRASTAQQQAGEYHALAITLNNIGSLYYELNQYGAALKYLKQSAATHEQHGDPACAQLGQTYNNMGVVCTSLGLAQEALNYFVLSLSNQSARSDLASEAVTRANLAKYHHLRGPLSEAVAQMARVVELDTRTNSPQLEKHQAKLTQLRGELADEAARGGVRVGVETSPGMVFGNQSANRTTLKTPLDLRQVIRSVAQSYLTRRPAPGFDEGH